MNYEYKCIGAPERPRRSRRAKTGSDRLARAMEKIMKDEAVNGWEYMRTDLVPVVEKGGFLSRPQEVHRAVLVFRRSLEEQRNKRRSEGGGMFGEAISRRKPAQRRSQPEPVAEPEPEAIQADAPEPVVADPAPAERPRRARAVPAEEPIRLRADDMMDPPQGRSGRDRSPPSGLG